ncbi:Type I restriction-modification system, specificity subunit S [Enhydrobacter sp. AX1]|nr:restriction endonuclease subunit S [Enhydrobacter sp. AX1]VXB72028.1 Type I restriction-modification system, specificity subunit S [Enhydrobacter sp. AX1]
MSYAKYESYKDSGVDWLREIPEHWQLKRLKYVLAERNERSKTGEEPLFMVSQKYGLVVRADYHDKAEIAQSNIDNKIVYKNDLVFNKLKPHLGVFYKSEIDFKGLVSPDYAVYKVKNYIYDMKYLELLFRNPKYIEQFIIRATGIVEGLIRLYTTELFELPVMIPPREEQEKILNFLHGKTAQIDQAIALKQQQIEKLNEYKQIVIQNAVTKGLNPNVPMKNSGVDWIGDIPEHWEVKKLKYLIDSKAGYAFPSQQFSQEGISVIRISELNINGSVDISNSPKLPFSFAKFLEEFCVVSGDILMAMTGGTIGKVSIYRENKKSLLNQRVCKFIVKASLDKKLFWHFCNSLYWKNYIDFKANGGAQPNISDNEIKKMYFPLPSISEQKTIANFLDEKTQNINQTIERYQTQIDRLKEYKNILINQAVTGKIKI